MPQIFQRLESVAIAAAVTVGFVVLGHDWWWLLVLFLAFDLSAIGYFVSPRVGALSYNAVHSYLGPAALLVLLALSGEPVFGFIGLAWAFHVAADRALGFGLKYPDAFEHTHLGWIGKRRVDGSAKP